MCLRERPRNRYGVQPEKLWAIGDVMRMHRDHYEGSPYDLTKGVQGAILILDLLVSELCL